MIKDLVFLQDKMVVTDSLTVAEVFRKEHSRVMRDIRELGCSDEFRAGNFAESSYVNSQNKELPKIFISQKGFTLLAMGYTGKEAMKFKESYINEFERMEKELNAPKVLSEKEQLVASMKLTLETSEEVSNIKNEVKEIRYMVQEQITLDHGEQRRIQKAVGSKVYELSPNPASNPRLFSELYKDIKDRFGVGSYKDIKRHDMLKAIRYIEAWVPRKAIS